MSSLNKPKILVVEDHQEAQLLFRRGLEKDYNLVMASTAKMAREAFNKKRPDAIVLDVSLPDGDGFRLCSEIRNNQDLSDIPILMVTARDQTEDKVFGLNLGADDYIVKPFDHRELAARVKALIRRASKSENQLLKVGDLLIDYKKFQVFHMDNPLQLTPLEFKVLCHLAKNNNLVISRNSLLDNVWGNEVAVTQRTVDVCLSGIRKKIAATGLSIESIYGVGYRLKVS